MLRTFLETSVEWANPELFHYEIKWHLRTMTQLGSHVDVFSLRPLEGNLLVHSTKSWSAVQMDAINLNYS